MIKQNYLLLLSFITGFSVMVIELTATRIIAPILGSSIYTWTSAIGVILLGSSIGNHFGGRVIDKHNKINTLASFFLAASLFVLFVHPIAFFTANSLLMISSLWLATLVATSILFFIPAFLLGSIYPMIAKQFFTETNKIGQRAGTLSAICSAGSIIGTFATGFYFTGYIGSNGTLLAISVLLLICGLFLFSERINKMKAFFLYILVISLYLGLTKWTTSNESTVYHKESSYYDIRVADKNLPIIGKARILFLDAGSHSIESLTGKKLDSYANIYPVFSVFKKNINDVLMIGGGSLELSDNIKEYYPDANVVTAEIDPEVTKIAQKYFEVSEHVIKNTISSDGRIFLSNSPKKYDVIFSDAYNSFISVPWHLTTKEFFQLSKSRLSEDGIFAMNFISAQKGENSDFYKSLVGTFASVYGNYYVFAYGDDPSSSENVVLIGVNSSSNIARDVLVSKLLKLDGGIVLTTHLREREIINSSESILLTDDFAPVDRLMMSSVNNYFSPYMNFIHKKS